MVWAYSRLMISGYFALVLVWVGAVGRFGLVGSLLRSSLGLCLAWLQALVILVWWFGGVGSSDFWFGLFRWLWRGCIGLAVISGVWWFGVSFGFVLVLVY